MLAADAVAGRLSATARMGRWPSRVLRGGLQRRRGAVPAASVLMTGAPLNRLRGGGSQ